MRAHASALPCRTATPHSVVHPPTRRTIAHTHIIRRQPAPVRAADLHTSDACARAGLTCVRMAASTAHRYGMPLHGTECARDMHMHTHTHATQDDPRSRQTYSPTAAPRRRVRARGRALVTRRRALFDERLAVHPLLSSEWHHKEGGALTCERETTPHVKWGESQRKQAT